MLDGNLCRDCGNRTKQCMHLMGWCLLKDKMVPLVVPTNCEMFAERAGAELQEPTPEMMAFVHEVREQLRKDKNRARNAKRSRRK